MPERQAFSSGFEIHGGLQMTQVLHREFVYIWYYFDIQLRQIFPYWVLGMVLGSAVSVFAKEKIHNAVRSLSGKRLGAFGVIPASALGIASPLCMYGTIPLAASFSRYGISDDWLAAFMMSSILLNPQLMIYSAALGTTALLVRIVSCFLCGIVAGLLVRFVRGKHFFEFGAFEEPKSRDTDSNILLRFLKNLGRNIKATGLYFLLGVVLSALFQRYVPAETMTAVFGGNEDGMSMGSAAAFMVTGPATKITNLGALKIVLGIKNFIIYLAYIMVFAFVTGLIVNWLI